MKVGKNSLACKLIWFTIVTVVMMVVMTVLFYWGNVCALRQETGRLITSYFDQVYTQITQSIVENSNLTEIFAYDGDVQGYFCAKDDVERYRRLQSVFELYTITSSINTNLQDLVLTDGQRDSVSLGGRIYGEEKIKRYIHSGLLPESGAVSIQDFSADYSTSSQGSSFIVTCPVYTNTGQNDIAGYLFSVMRMERLLETLEQIRITPSSKVMICGPSGEFLCGTQGSAQLWETAGAASLSEFSGEQSIGGSQYLCFRGEREKMLFTLYSFVPRDEIYAYNKGFPGSVAVLIIINAAVILSMAFFINRSFRLPITRLLESMERVKQGDWRSRALLEDRGEIGNLACNFNDMMNRIELMTHTITENQARMYRLELSSRRMELKALQEQINPHFLYNTLACIRGIAVCNNQPEISQITKSLAEIYRYILRAPDVVPLSEELQNVRHYLEIQKIRLGERLRTDIQIAPGLLEHRILKLILQPLVENAVEHGISQKLGGGTVWLLGREEKDYIELTVADDGVGLDPQVLEEIRLRQRQNKSEEKGHIGIFNVISRLNLRYGERCRFSCEIRPGGGTQVCIRIPIAKECGIDETGFTGG